MSGKLVGELGSSIFCNYYRTFFLPMSLNWTYWKSMVARDQFWASLNKRTITTDKITYRTFFMTLIPNQSPANKKALLLAGKRAGCITMLGGAYFRITILRV